MSNSYSPSVVLTEGFKGQSSRPYVDHTSISFINEDSSNSIVQQDYDMDNMHGWGLGSDWDLQNIPLQENALSTPQAPNSSLYATDMANTDSIAISTDLWSSIEATSEDTSYSVTQTPLSTEFNGCQPTYSTQPPAYSNVQNGIPLSFQNSDQFSMSGPTSVARQKTKGNTTISLSSQDSYGSSVSRSTGATSQDTNDTGGLDTILQPRLSPEEQTWDEQDDWALAEAPLTTVTENAGLLETSLRPTRLQTGNRTKAQMRENRKSVHRMIEKKYRSRISSGLAELRDCVPKQVQIVDEALETNPKPGMLHKSCADQTQSSAKVTTLTDAVLYIKELELNNGMLHDSLDLLQRRHSRCRTGNL